MSPGKLIVVVASCLALIAADSPSPGHLLMKEPTAATDLEVTGMAADIAPGKTRYVSYEQLLTLPQTTVSIQGDENFRELSRQKVTVTGVYLDVLASYLGALPDSDVVTALCSDGYRATYPRVYVKTHRPILALKIDGLSVASWAAQTHNGNPGTYFITHENFTPSYSILSFQEIPKIPTNVTRLEFGTSQQTYGAISPHLKDATNPQVVDGFHIAEQHCYRCHNMGSYGGTKAGKSWQTLGNFAASSPTNFERYLHDPKSVDPKSTMSCGPQLKDPAAKALQAYFRTFSTTVN
jgi:cytochrome c2